MSRPASQPRVAVVVALWDPDRSAAAVTRLRAVWGAGDATIVGVANSEAIRAAPPGGLDAVVAGSNADAEFSAYDEGLARLRESAASAEVLVVANDRAFSYDDPSKVLARTALLDHVAHHPVAVGRVDALPRPMTLMGKRVHRYLRSNLVLLPAAAIPHDFRLTSLSGRCFDELVPPAFDGTLRLDALASPDYAAFVRGWLTGTGTGAADRWYRAHPLDESSWPVLRAKVKSIVNEHLLSARLRDLGLTILGPRAAASTWVTTRGGRSVLSASAAGAAQLGSRRQERRA